MRIALNVANSSYSCSGQNTLIHVLEAVNAGDWSVGGRLALFSAVLRPSHERQGGDVWTTGVPTRSPSRRQRPLPVWGPSRSRTPAITASSLARAGAYCRRSTNHAKQTWARAMLTPPCTRGPCSHARSYSHARILRYFDIVDGGDLNVLNANIQLNAGKVWRHIKPPRLGTPPCSCRVPIDIASCSRCVACGVACSTAPCSRRVALPAPPPSTTQFSFRLKRYCSGGSVPYTSSFNGISFPGSTVGNVTYFSLSPSYVARPRRVFVYLPC